MYYIHYKPMYYSKSSNITLNLCHLTFQALCPLTPWCPLTSRRSDSSQRGEHNTVVTPSWQVCLLGILWSWDCQATCVHLVKAAELLKKNENSPPDPKICCRLLFPPTAPREANKKWERERNKTRGDGAQADRGGEAERGKTLSQKLWGMS